MRFSLFFILFLFSAFAQAETLILCSEYGPEGRRPSVLEAWLEQPQKRLQPNSCEQILAQKLSVDFFAQKLWAVDNADSVYRKKTFLDRQKKDWAKVHELELEDFAASFSPKPQQILACTLRPLKDETLRDFRTQYLYQAECKWQHIGHAKAPCIAKWASKAVAETKKKPPFDPVIAQIIQNGSTALAKCWKDR